MQQDRQKPIVVVGAGIVGLAIAFRLQQSGERVTLIDRKDPGREASFGNVGLIASSQIFPLSSPATMMQAPSLLLGRDGPLAILPAYLPTVLPWLARFALASTPASFRRGTVALCSLQQHAIATTRSLYEDAGISDLLVSGGHLMVAEKKSSESSLLKERSAAQRHGVNCDWLSAEEVAERAPALVRPVAGALHYRDNIRVRDPYDVCAGLHNAFTAAGGETLRDDVRHLHVDADGRVNVGTAAQKLVAGKLVLAAGAWSRPLAEQLGYPVPLDTERGYHVMAPGWSGQLDCVVASHERKVYMNPMSGGLRISGFAEFGGLELGPVPSRFEALKRQATALLPGIQWPTMTEWMGFRPSMSDHLPVIGVSPRHENVIFAFGHQHVGLTLAAVTANIVSALSSGEASPVDLEPFRIDRF